MMQDKLARFAPLPLRLMLGAGFVYHGFPKLFPGQGHVEFADTLRNLAIPAPETIAWLAGVIECVGGLMLLAGVWTVAVSAVLLVDMVISAVIAYWPAGLPAVIGRPQADIALALSALEMHLLYIASLASLLLSGPGVWALGRRSVKPRWKQAETQTVIRAEPDGVPIDAHR